MPLLPRLYGFRLSRAYGSRTARRINAYGGGALGDLEPEPRGQVCALRRVLQEALYREDSNMEIFLITVTVLLLAIASARPSSPSHLHVSARTKQIGTRRAVGARRADIVRYFMVENG